MTPEEVKAKTLEDIDLIKNKENIIKACSFYKIKKKLVKNIVEKIGEIRYLFSVSKKKI